MRAGCQWRQLPREFPTWHFRKWHCTGVWVRCNVSFIGSHASVPVGRNADRRDHGWRGHKNGPFKVARRGRCSTWTALVAARSIVGGRGTLDKRPAAAHG
ncbi:hypothetical protein [Aminobacter ciceronei]|uniref:hypothetical protein n=1 Tax=Aminobacter ciceronei TaxID=150723 RepID=UPI0015FD3D51